MDYPTVTMEMDSIGDGPQQQPAGTSVKIASSFVDYVLVWESHKSKASSSDTKRSTNGGGGGGSEKRKEKEEEEDRENAEKRRIFEKNLKLEGLILEQEELEVNASVHFVKIHAPLELLRRYAEILKLRLPMKEDLSKLSADAEALKKELKRKVVRARGSIKSALKSIRNGIIKQFQVDETKFPPVDQRLTAIYSRDKEYLFDIHEPEFFSQEIRARIVDFILKRKRFSEDPTDQFSFGITKLIDEKAYIAAYPLHDGDLKTPGSCRHILFTEWASLRKCLKQQPLDAIKEYFGVNIGLYYAWLGFYTQMLIFATILGFMCILYGILTLKTNNYSQDICNGVVSEDMCPLCNRCDYWKLNSTCTYAKLTYVFDNNSTVIFAVLMSFWAAIFLEFWKRYSSEITYKWDLTSLEEHEEQPRIEYLTTIKKIKKIESNDAGVIGEGAGGGTLDEEPHISFWKTKVPLTLLSLSTVLFMVTMAGAVLVAIITYRSFSIWLMVDNLSINRSRAMLVASSTAACLNLVMISIFNYLYTFVAQYLTELELHRTQSEFDASLTLKIYLLQFINFYSSIFYIAFFKGRFIGPPNFLRGVLTQEECGPSGCMTDLCIQLAIIMIGKQFVNAVLEMTGPLITKWLKYFRIRSKVAPKESKQHKKMKTRWGQDLKLLDWQPRQLMYEYLEMVLQYGFITIFVAAFPVAPFFALLNNILEMRLDGTKMLVYNRRPVGQRVKDIGIWYDILHTVSKIAVISNAFIIAFTSNFIPKLVYKMEEKLGNGNLDGFLRYSLTAFSTSDFTNDTLPSGHDVLKSEEPHPPYCLYQNYHFSFNEKDESLHYQPTWFYWKVLMARLVFVVVFENFVSFCVLVLKAIIPDVPKKLKNRIRREINLTNEIILREEMKRALEEKENKSGGSGEAGGGSSFGPNFQHMSTPAVRRLSMDSQGSDRAQNINDYEEIPV